MNASLSLFSTLGFANLDACSLASKAFSSKRANVLLIIHHLINHLFKKTGTGTWDWKYQGVLVRVSS